MKYLMQSQGERLKTIEQQNVENKKIMDIRETKRTIYSIDEVVVVWPLLIAVANAKIFSIFDLQIKLLRHEYLMRTSTSDQKLSYQALEA